MAKDLKDLRSLGSEFGEAGLCLSPDGPASCFHLNLTVTHVLGLIPSCFLSPPPHKVLFGLGLKCRHFPQILA